MWLPAWLPCGLGRDDAGVHARRGCRRPWVHRCAGRGGDRPERTAAGSWPTPAWTGLSEGWSRAAIAAYASCARSGLLQVCLFFVVGPAGWGERGDGRLPGPGAGPCDQLALFLALASGATYAATTVLGHTLASQVDSVALTTCATAAGTVALAPFFGLTAASGEPPVTRDADSLALLIYLGSRRWRWPTVCCTPGCGRPPDPQPPSGPWSSAVRSEENSAPA